MKSLVINFENEALLEKVEWMLERFKQDGLEVVSREDYEDYKLLAQTRGEPTVSLQELLNS